MRQKILFNILAIVITLGIVAAVFNVVFYGMYLKGAASAGCNENIQSSLICDPVIYIKPFLFWSFILLLLITAAILFTQMQSKKSKKK